MLANDVQGIEKDGNNGLWVPRIEPPLRDRVGRARKGAAPTFAHPCCVCGGLGVFGYGVDLRAALGRVDLSRARRRQLAGRWYCAEHRPEKARFGLPF